MIISLCASQPKASAELAIKFTEPPQSGSIVALLFDSAEGFEDFNAPIDAIQVPADGRDSIAFVNLPAGNYALLVYHDQNDNQQLDLNFIGIPKEALGFANNYMPKGPPSFERALLAYDPAETSPVQIELAKPLGNIGRFGVGAGVIARGSPYLDSDDNPVTFIPALTYIGNRVQITGPYAQIGLIGSGQTRLAATLAYRQAVYEEDDSPILAGMKDREDTAMAGLSLQVDLPWGGFDLSGGYAHDLLDRIGGGEASIQLSRPIPWERLRISPLVALHWMDDDLVLHDYGVSPAEATDSRPAYQPDHAITIETGIGIFAEITPSLYGIGQFSIEWFDSEIADSPIIDEDFVWQGAFFLSYML